MSIESHRAPAELRESEEHYRAVAQAVTDAIITIVCYTTEEMIGHPLTMLKPARKTGKVSAPRRLARRSKCGTDRFSL